MFCIVIVGGPVEKYIDRCLHSVVAQDVSDWKACVVLDPTGDATIERAEKYTTDSRIKVLSNSMQLYAVPNIIQSILQMGPKDDDVIVTLDADDWFSGPDTLSIVKKYYDADPNLLLTYGSWVSYPNYDAITNCKPYSQEDFDKGVRKVDWRATHLRTFKYKVWKYVQDQDLRNEQGEYFKSGWDLAIMWPMLEMAGLSRTKFLSEKLYIYNQETPFNDSKLRLKEQMAYADYIAAMKPYSYRDTF